MRRRDFMAMFGGRFPVSTSSMTFRPALGREGRLIGRAYAFG